MHQIDSADLTAAVTKTVTAALEEDIRDGDISAGLIPEQQRAQAQLLFRDSAILCGQAWVDEVFRQIDPRVQIEWRYGDGDRVPENTLATVLTGPARALLSGERVALNFVQLLSATATRTAECVALLSGTSANLLDTRKTLPGLRLAQKYAVTCGGGQSHRMGLYDAFLIKENHIEACGGILESVRAARAMAPGKWVEVEVETLDQLDQALAAGAEVIMLDNFSLDDTRTAVMRTDGRARIEASGGVNRDTLRAIAETGVDYISMGTLTKDVRSIDLSMRLTVEA